jgi:hypothetical protein
VVLRPEYRQLEALLSFLVKSMRADPVLLQRLGSPQQIVASYATSLRLKPESLGTDRMPLFDAEVPMLAVFETASKTVHRAGMEGDEVTLELWYAFDLPAGSADLRPEEWGARIAKLVWWQIRGYLRRGSFDHDGTEFDLCADGKIDRVVSGTSRLIEHDRYGGFAATITMTHFEPPYSEDPLTTLTSVELDLKETETSTVLVEGDITLDA